MIWNQKAGQLKTKQRAQGDHSGGKYGTVYAVRRKENLNQPKRTRVAGKKETAEHKTHTAAKRASGKKVMPEPKKKPALAGVIFGIGVFAIAVQFLGMFAEDSLPAFETVFEHGTDDDLWEADDFWNEEEVREKPELIQWRNTG